MKRGLRKSAQPISLLETPLCISLYLSLYLHPKIIGIKKSKNLHLLYRWQTILMRILSLYMFEHCPVLVFVYSLNVWPRTWALPHFSCHLLSVRTSPIVVVRYNLLSSSLFAHDRLLSISKHSTPFFATGMIAHTAFPKKTALTHCYWFYRIKSKSKWRSRLMMSGAGLDRL